MTLQSKEFHYLRPCGGIICMKDKNFNVHLIEIKADRWNVARVCLWPTFENAKRWGIFKTCYSSVIILLLFLIQIREKKLEKGLLSFWKNYFWSTKIVDIKIVELNSSLLLIRWLVCILEKREPERQHLILTLIEGETCHIISRICSEGLFEGSY